jgi:hypothetical protein
MRQDGVVFCRFRSATSWGTFRDGVMAMYRGRGRRSNSAVESLSLRSSKDAKYDGRSTTPTTLQRDDRPFGRNEIHNVEM